MDPSLGAELAHRGDPLADYPDPRFWVSLGGAAGVEALVTDLYRRMSAWVGVSSVVIFTLIRQVASVLLR